MTTAVVFSRYADLPVLIGLMEGDEKHSEAAHSTLDVLWTLYDRVLHITPENADAPDRDRFVLSTVPGPAAYSAVLAAPVFLDVVTQRDWAALDSSLGLQPARTLGPGVELASVALGRGLPLALGIALGVRAQT